MEMFESLKNLLKNDERLVSDGKLLKNKIIELGLKLDKELIKLLLTNEIIKEFFFKDIDGVLVFDKEKFVKFIDNKEFLPDSYTSFKNKIRLAADNNYIAKSKEVALVWPYKDCILEGGQEEPEEKRREIFYNEILAPDEIDRLLDPKVFTNFKRIDKNGEHKVEEIKPTDNLIIKGNNLLVLNSLKKKFAGRVKLIYIDPPYNTGNDEFKYNDNFNHSTWLTFMKNRLEVAKELLREDGVIFAQCDNNEQAYLKVLMDEIFNRENFISDVAVRSSTPSGIKTAHKEKTIIKQRDSILVFAKNKINLDFKPQYSKLQKWDAHYSVWIQKTLKGAQLLKLEKKLKDEKILSKVQSLQDININDKKFKDFYLKNADKIARWTSHKNKEIIKTCLTEYKDKFYITKDNEGKETIYLNKQVLQPLIYSIKDVYDNKKITKDVGMLVCDFWDDIDFQNTQNEGGVSLPTGKKPEFLLYRIIKMSTEPGDIILDYHLGSGTTCAVAHKMGRQYIGIEQLDYGKNSAVVRLKNVINGDQSGISKAAGWKGGGDFVCLELMKLNEDFVERIQGAKDRETLLSIWEEMKLNGFLSYRLDPKLFDENIEEFKKLSIDEQKRLLLETLDKNYLYVNYSEIEDEMYKVKKEDKKLNMKFYGGNENA